MSKNVIHYEPHQALFVDDRDPLIFYEAITDFAIKHLDHEGKLYFEMNEKYGTELVTLLKQRSFTDIILKKDINGKNRILCCTLQGHNIRY